MKGVRNGVWAFGKRLDGRGAAGKAVMERSRERLERMKGLRKVHNGRPGNEWEANGKWMRSEQKPSGTEQETDRERSGREANGKRTGNGYIDYDEIVWYVPALDELAELYSAMNDAGRGNVFFQNDESRFHSSTPYLAGYTAEVPGRAFYVKMDSGETAFAMRDRQYNVICCRRVGAWRGNEDAGFGAGVTENDDWNEDETDIIPKRESGGLSGAE